MASSVPIDFSSGDHYSVLGVQRNATEAEIAKAYKLLALKYHPDKNQGNNKDAEIGFKRISEAYSVLRDSQKRAEYDRTGGTRSYVSYDEAEQMWQQFSSREGQAQPESPEGRRKAMALLLVAGLLLFAPNLLMQVLPGLAAALICLALISRREAASKWAWCAVALLAASYILPYVVGARSSFEQVDPQLHQLGEPSTAPVGIPESGEEVLLNDGNFQRVPDPSKRDGSAGEGWQQRLLEEMTTAIKTGHEQVLTVFSRQGCPWCQRQLPVLQRAIAQRAGRGGTVQEEAPEASQAFLAPAAVGMARPPSGASLMSAPLRVFVLYAEEFPSVAQAFKVEAFPTLIAWGLPGVPSHWRPRAIWKTRI
ncbi:unnamed protein product [Effrenium voratum]|uniref:J domain-containing protein n=1 Tax=Effrenium voratum TaxID=2562239 RepID=A0AA36NFJ1_9DINO|nr:unnamed protein product [Effrenium voratum]